MKRKNFITAVFFIILYTTGNAQITTFTSADNGHKYKLVTAPIPAQLDCCTPFTRVFLETGNGNFFQFSTSTNASEEFIKPLYFSNSSKVQPVVQLNTFYDTTRIPPLASSFIFIPPVDNSGTNYQSRIPNSQSILITPSIALTPGPATIIPRDTMTLAISYKAVHPAEIGILNDRTVIAFYYNASGITNLFSPIDAATQYNFSGTPTKAIRMHNAETIVSLSSLPSQIQGKLNENIGSFTQVLYISAPCNSSEKNIFLSLAPNANPSDYTRLQSYVRAVVIDYRSSDPSKYNVQYIDQYFGINFKSRDPSYMTVSPFTFKNKASAIDKKVNYNIHFENEGAGPAKSIIIEVEIPKGMRLPASGENMFTCTLGGRRATTVSRLTGHVMNTYPKLCHYAFDRSHNKITFTINDADLKGSVESNGINDRGDIVFSLRTQDAVNMRYLNSCMFSKVSITFDGNPPVVSYFTTRVGPDFSIVCQPDVTVFPRPN
ncbi:MAG: hypothetical protein ABI685_02285 [Ferruginibacter sp.]